MSRRKRSNRKDTRTYSIFDANNKRTYVGSTNNMRRRAWQHLKSGKLKKGGRMIADSDWMTRQDAERHEGRKLMGFKRRTGRLPKDNTTSDGLFRSWFR